MVVAQAVTRSHSKGDIPVFTLRRRPTSEKLIDGGFKRLVVVLASIVGLVLIGILITVLLGSREVMVEFGLSFLVVSD